MDVRYPICFLGSEPTLLLFLFASNQGTKSTKFTKVSMTFRGTVHTRHSARRDSHDGKAVDEKDGLPKYTQVVSVLLQMQARNVTTKLQNVRGVGICFDTSKASNV